MSYRCDLCDKKTRMGRTSRHHPGVAGKQWKRRAQKTIRTFKPNLHVVTMRIEGVLRRVKACTRCIKRVKFDQNRKESLTQKTVIAS